MPLQTWYKSSSVTCSVPTRKLKHFSRPNLPNPFKFGTSLVQCFKDPTSVNKYITTCPLCVILATVFMNLKFRCYKSTFGAIDKGIALSSVRMHKNSPKTVIMIMAIVVTSHHDTVFGRYPFMYQQKSKWKKWIVAVKSKHCFVRLTMYHNPTALKY